MKTIGLDVHLRVCYNEGYIMLQMDERKPFDRTKKYLIKVPYPRYTGKTVEYKFRGMLSFDELEAFYREHMDELEDSCEDVDFSNPCEYDLLYLADSISFMMDLDRV